MDPGEARRVLGIAEGAGPDGLRAAYRAALRRSHPDLHGGDGGATRVVVEAYRVLQQIPDPPDLPAAPPPPVAPAVVVDGDTVAADLPSGDLFAMLHEVGHLLGEVAYADRQAGLLEVVVTFEGFGACSVVLTLQGRAAGLTEASCTVEPLGSGSAPPAGAVAELLAEGLRSVSGERAGRGGTRAEPSPSADGRDGDG